MKLQWLGHSCFLLEESTGTAIITDPYDKKLTGFEMPGLRADVVTCSHNHADHNYVIGVKGSPKIINRPGLFEFAGVKITSIPSYHDNQSGKLRGANLVFKFRIDGIDICHMGDIGQDITPELADALMPVNILLIPVGGNYTIDAEQAFDYVTTLMPDVVIPMHFKTPDCKIDIDKPDSFIKMFDDSVVCFEEDVTLRFDRDDFEQDYTRVIVPKRYY
ncbi:MAG: MBL fold metallo-hydrolase [Clostridiales bacterium]|jgi:L-ascorbate metabolism protein UlaG (beta-lactamase superfamily)|nr:MBL fold metallo-hydrolase [Clostridiales bacterium]